MIYFEKALTIAITRGLCVNAFPQLAPVSALAWDHSQKTKLPRISIHVTRGEELAYRSGIYRARVEVKAFVKPKDKNYTAEGLAGDAEAVLVSDLLAHEKLTDNRIHIFAFEAGGMDSKTEGGIRTATLRAQAVAFLKMEAGLATPALNVGLLTEDNEVILTEDGEIIVPDL